VSRPAGGLIGALGLAPHPEGGWYRELYRSALEVATARGPRAALTSIYYLLEQPQTSRWHVVAADEIWHFYTGDPLELLTYDPGALRLERHVLTSAGAGEGPVAAVPCGVWQAARTLGSYSLVGCTVGPGFDFADFCFVASLPGHAAHFAAALAAFRELL
jgi:predicted cupin superfamily sugar epimerase